MAQVEVTLCPFDTMLLGMPCALDAPTTLSASALSADDAVGVAETEETDSTPTCIVVHAATPAQLCHFEEGFQYYFVGPDGTQGGPLLSSISALAEIHPTGSPVAELYHGQNPLSGKPVRIDFLPDERILRISTYYADTPSSTDKPYVFTVDEQDGVTHLSW